MNTADPKIWPAAPMEMPVPSLSIPYQYYFDRHCLFSYTTPNVLIIMRSGAIINTKSEIMDVGVIADDH
jgi:hypothetical protein